MRKGSANSAPGAKRFVEELVARCRRAGATGELVLSINSGFWSNDAIDPRTPHDTYTMAVRTGNRAIAEAIAGIEEDAWVGIDYTKDGIAEVAETTYTESALSCAAPGSSESKRSLPTGGTSAFSPTWTGLRSSSTPTTAPRPCRARHQGPEGRCRDGTRPLRHFFANSAWLYCAVLAHDLVRRCAFLGGIVDNDELTVTRTLRHRYFSVPARLVDGSGVSRLRGPADGPGPIPSPKRWESLAPSI